jgi:putative transport protein
MIVGKEKELDEFITKIGRASTDSFIESDSDISKKIFS